LKSVIAQETFYYTMVGGHVSLISTLTWLFCLNACTDVIAVPLTPQRLARSEQATTMHNEAVVTPSANIQSAAPVSDALTFDEETKHIERILRSFGKLKPDYKGKQRLLGFQKDRLFDENGMFAFDDSIKSVAFDIGAATNPLYFDLGADATQLVFLFEALPGTSDGMEVAFERDNVELQKRGGCDTRWDPFCGQDRYLWFKSAVSPKVGYVDFIVSDNPYCGSLGGFMNVSDFDPVLLHDPTMNVRINACWNVTRKTVKIPSVSLASILKRIPESIKVKYMKIDAQGHDFNILMSADKYISRIEYVRFEMQVDPPPGRKMVKDVPSYAEVVDMMKQRGFVFEGKHACDDSTMDDFSKAIRESECRFCQHPPCLESGAPPLGIAPSEVVKREGSWASLVHDSHADAKEIK